MTREDKRLKRRVRTSYFVSTVSIAMVLFLLGATAYLILNALGATERLREGIVVHVMLQDGLSVEQTSAMRTSLELDEMVRRVDYITKAQAAERFIAESGEDFRTFLGDDPAANPLPDSFEVGLSAGGAERERIETFVAGVEAMAGVDEVVYQRGVVEQIGANIGKFNLVLALFGGALSVVSLVLLSNTVRMTIIAKRRVINTMKLVGARRSFIMRQFVGAAVLHGLYAGLIATAIFALLVLGIGEGIPELGLLRGGVLIASIAGGMIVGGVAVSLLFTVSAVHRAVRAESGKALM